MVNKYKLEENEFVFGGCVNDGIKMPYKDGFSRDLRVWHSGNQAISALLTSKGNYFYSKEPFKFEIKDGFLIIESDFEIKASKGNEKTLKGAYVGLKNDFFIQDHKHPNLDMFRYPQYNTWIEFGRDVSQAKVKKYAEEIINNGYPSGVLMIDDCWSKDYGEWEFDRVKFPNPKELIDYLHNLNFKVMLWLCPFVSPDSPTYRELSLKGYLVKNKNGLDAISYWWNGFSAVLDLTKPEVREYFYNVLKKLQNEYGIDGFKIDAGDPEYYSDDFVYSTGEQKSFQAHYLETIGERFDFNELRASFNNSLKGVAQRLRDKNHSYDVDGINTLIPNSIAMGLCGYPYLCPDMIGGGMISDFEVSGFKLDQNLYVRYAEISSLLPMMQFSLLPFKALDEENNKIVKKYVDLHLEYSNLIVELVKKASIDGLPIIRSLLFNYGEDKYAKVMDEFMLGEDILVAPIVSKESSRKVILPKGKWQARNGEVYNEGEYQFEVERGDMPIFKRVKL